MDLDHICDHFPACQAVIDSVRSLALSVTDIRAEIPRAITAFFCDSFSYLFHQQIQVSASRMTVSVGALHHNLYFIQIFFFPAGSDPQRIQFRR